MAPINRLTAGPVGDPSNSTGPEIATTVNALIDVAENDTWPGHGGFSGNVVLGEHILYGDNGAVLLGDSDINPNPELRGMFIGDDSVQTGQRTIIRYKGPVKTLHDGSLREVAELQGSQDTLIAGKTVINVLTHSSDAAVNPNEYILIKTNITKAARICNLDFTGSFGAYTNMGTMQLGWYWYNNAIYSPQALVSKVFADNIDVKIGIINNKFCVAMQNTPHAGFSVSVINRKVLGIPENELLNWSSSIVDVSALTGFTDVNVVESYNKNNPQIFLPAGNTASRPDASTLDADKFYIRLNTTTSKVEFALGGQSAWHDINSGAWPGHGGFSGDVVLGEHILYGDNGARVLHDDDTDGYLENRGLRVGDSDHNTGQRLILESVGAIKILRDGARREVAELQGSQDTLIAGQTAVNALAYTEISAAYAGVKYVIVKTNIPNVQGRWGPVVTLRITGNLQGFARPMEILLSGYHNGTTNNFDFQALITMSETRDSGLVLKQKHVNNKLYLAIPVHYHAHFTIDVINRHQDGITNAEIINWTGELVDSVDNTYSDIPTTVNYNKNNPPTSVKLPYIYARGGNEENFSQGQKLWFADTSLAYGITYTGKDNNADGRNFTISEAGVYEVRYVGVAGSRPTTIVATRNQKSVIPSSATPSQHFGQGYARGAGFSLGIDPITLNGMIRCNAGDTIQIWVTNGYLLLGLTGNSDWHNQLTITKISD